MVACNQLEQAVMEYLPKMGGDLVYAFWCIKLLVTLGVCFPSFLLDPT
jgi:hypothetical protein